MWVMRAIRGMLPRKPRPGALVYRCGLCDASYRIKKANIDRQAHLSLAYAFRIPHDCPNGLIGIAELTGCIPDNPTEPT